MIITTTTGNITTYWDGRYTVPSYSYHICTAPTVIEKYQLICPRCETTNWGQIDEIVTCKKCAHTLKAVRKSIDYEIVVND